MRKNSRVSSLDLTSVNTLSTKSITKSKTEKITSHVMVWIPTSQSQTTIEAPIWSKETIPKATLPYRATN